VLVILIVIGLAFAICISTILNLLYKERLTALITFLLASMVDIVLLRPSIILIDSVLTFLGIRLTGSFRRKNKVSQRDEKSLLVGVEKNSDETNTPQDVSSSAALVREDYKSSNLKTANDSG
jgi:thiamine transporter ThiT